MRKKNFPVLVAVPILLIAAYRLGVRRFPDPPGVVTGTREL